MALLSTVMRGLDPHIHLISRMMNCRVKPGNDNRSTRPGTGWADEETTY
jgi:hypothetical protein